MNRFFLRLLVAIQQPRRDAERGATAIEYGLIAALIAGVIAATVGTVGGKLVDAFNAAINW